MAVVVTAVSGYDLGYVWKGQGAAAAPEPSAGGYYINAAQAGEPPGRWWGPGAEALGFAVGQLVEREPYEKVYRQVHPVTGQKMGRAPGSYDQFADVLLRLKAAEPYATAERLVELEREAAQQARQAPAYTDMTVSFSKSISVFHASIRESERRARLAGDQEAAGYWAGAERRYQEVVQAANRAGLEYVQRWAGITRSGYHGARVNGQELGRFEEALITVSSWLQGTSRDGDPQDHIHNQIARIVETVRDGKHRALDTATLRQVLAAVQAIVATHAECGLSREFGVAWVPRRDGIGNEIAGVTQAQMDRYSSRAAAIAEELPNAAAAWAAKYGREPSQRELLFIQNEVTLTTRRGKADGAIDWEALCASWEARWDAQWGPDLASVASRISALRGPGHAEQARGSGAGPERAELIRAAQQALAVVQMKHSTWTRSDFLKELGYVLPVQTRNLDPAASVRLLEELADQALAGGVEPVVCLEAPEWPPLPGYLRRELDGRSVYTRPGTARYATRVQLSLEERLLQEAQRHGAPHLDRDQAARLLGADAAGLEAQLHERAQESRTHATGSGLRLDQGAALFHALTSDRTVEVIVGPAGSGKTRTLAQASRAWIDAGRGEVVGIATAQAARNVLASAGVDVAENSAVFLGHLPGQRNARGIRQVEPGTLLVIDEASMMSMTDLTQIVAHAAASGAKVIICGDQEQLEAVESGGGMMLLARRLGHVQLAEAVRFTQRWERDASLRLRAGDASVLDIYREHGRILGAEPEQALSSAVRRYVAHYLAGRDTLLMVHDREWCREVSRRIRDDLIHLGIVQPGPEVRLADGARASAGDLIIARQNNHRLEAGEPGRTLANGDTLRIESISGQGQIMVRRALDCDPGTGQRKFTDRAFAYRGYGSDDLAYAVTGHSAQGRTVKVGMPLLTGTESRQWLYVAMTRGTDGNWAVAFTRSARVADPQAGTRPAPELERHERMQRERDGRLPRPAEPGSGPAPRDAVGVMADMLDNSAAEESALETQRRELAGADHLARLNAYWQGETAGLDADRYRKIVLDVLPAEWAADGLASRQSTWLWRTLRAAEAAGCNVREATERAVAERPLAGTRDVASVLDFHIRQQTAGLVPQPPRPWSQRVPEAADPQRQEFLRQLAAAMDARRERIGEHAAQYSLAWAIHALGPVPDDPLDRLEWERRASDIGAYRELYSYDHPTEPIGPEPAGDSPEKRAAWHGAFASMRPAGGLDFRSLPDGSLLHMRGTYETETAWAPRHVGRQLQQVRAGAEMASLEAVRAQAEERVARERGEENRAARHGLLSRSYTAMSAFYQDKQAELEDTMQARREWEKNTESTRRHALATDSEYRRRHPDQKLEPLRSAEPVVTDEEHEQLMLIAGAQEYQTPEWIRRLAEERLAVRERLDERKGVRVPHEDPDYQDEGEAWPAWAERDRDAILQPPKPEMRPAPELERAAEARTDAEAGG